MRLALVALLFPALVPDQALAAEKKCLLLCAPELKIEPTISVSNLFRRPRIAELEQGRITAVRREEREAEFEIILSVGIPTAIPRVALTLEAIWTPFAGASRNPFTGKTAEELGRSEIRDNPVELEFETNFYILEAEQTGGWVEMHFDVVDQFSPAERPADGGVYTHKLDLELDTAFLVFNRLPAGSWLRNLEVEISLDYLATGIPRAGDVFPGGKLFLDDASPWSLSIVFVVPVAPFSP
jgi:hypothetical protein